jgi:hypothetical protein
MSAEGQNQRGYPHDPDAQVQQMYARTLEDVTKAAFQQDADGGPEAVYDAAEDFVEGLSWLTLTAIITASDHGPHNRRWKQHDFDHESPDGALRSLAASAIVTDILTED